MPVAKKKCELHRGHFPAPRTFERHHPTPQAWQQFWKPGVGSTGRSAVEATRVVAMLSAATQEMRAAALFDKRTILCCPTGHRNVHYWLVQLMHAAEQLESEDPLHAALRVFGGAPRDTTKATAYLTLCRWREHGGSLLALAAVGLYGHA